MCNPILISFTIQTQLFPSKLGVHVTTSTSFTTLPTSSEILKWFSINDDFVCTKTNTANAAKRGLVLNPTTVCYFVCMFVHLCTPA